eukprot:13344057-Heterocapsa_arctica.AAC.1
MNSDVSKSTNKTIHAIIYGIPWDISQDCEFVKLRCPEIPEVKYADRTCTLITWSHYFSAAAGLPSAQPYFSTTAQTIRQIVSDPKPQAWTDYCLVLSGQWIHGTGTKKQPPTCRDSGEDQADRPDTPSVATRLKPGQARREYGRRAAPKTRSQNMDQGSPDGSPGKWVDNGTLWLRDYIQPPREEGLTVAHLCNYELSTNGTPDQW